MATTMRTLTSLLIALILACSPAWAVNVVVGWYGASAPAYTEEYFWNGDYSGDTDKAEITHRSTQLDGTLTGATVAAGSSDPGTASPDGGNCLKLDPWTERLAHTVTGGNIFSSAEGYMRFYIYGAPTESHQIFLAYVDASNFVFIWWSSDNKIHLRHMGGSTDNSVTSSSAVTDNTWTLVSARWSDPGNTIGVKIGAGAWADNAAATAAFASEPATIIWGNTGSGYDAGETWLDGMQIWTNYAGT